MADGITWRWREPSHLEAHRKDFIVPADDILETITPSVLKLRPQPLLIEKACRRSAPIWLHTDFNTGYSTGLSGLREVNPDGSESFWGYRLRRMIPSHLCFGDKVETGLVCLWGWWEPDCFVIHTLYPGAAAPREIHDPELLPSEIPEAIEFWRRNAIVVKEGEYSEAAEL